MPGRVDIPFADSGHGAGDWCWAIGNQGLLATRWFSNRDMEGAAEG